MNTVPCAIVPPSFCYKNKIIGSMRKLGQQQVKGVQLWMPCQRAPQILALCTSKKACGKGFWGHTTHLDSQGVDQASLCWDSSHGSFTCSMTQEKDVRVKERRNANRSGNDWVCWNREQVCSVPLFTVHCNVVGNHSFIVDNGERKWDLGTFLQWNLLSTSDSGWPDSDPKG